MSARLMAGCLTAAVLAVVIAVTGAAAPGQAKAAPGERGQSVPGAVTIVRDEYGVPHVYAQTARALFYGDG